MGYRKQNAVTSDGILFPDANKVNSSTAAGSSGQILQSAGAGVAPAYTTATYPATATGTGTILRADGTNWSATTATYPNTGGTSLNILQSDGTNFVSTAPLIYVLSGNINSATFKTIRTTPVVLVAAPGGTKCLNAISFIHRLNYGGNNAFTTGGNFNLKYNNASGSTITTESASVYTSASTQTAGTFCSFSGSNNTNQQIVLTTASADPGGNAAGDNTFDWWLMYSITF